MLIEFPWKCTQVHFHISIQILSLQTKDHESEFITRELLCTIVFKQLYEIICSSYSSIGTDLAYCAHFRRSLMSE